LTDYTGDVEYAPSASGTSTPLADISRAQQKLKYQPLVGFEEGLRRTVEWYRMSEAASRGTDGQPVTSVRTPFCCHPERSGYETRSFAHLAPAESKDLRSGVAVGGGGEPQIPPLGLKPSVGMTNRITTAH